VSEPFRIVHVDDEEGVLRQVKELLEEDEQIQALGGVTVTRFKNFPEALEYLDRAPADMVILDVRKDGEEAAEPQLAGREAFLELRAKVFVPVVFYTGFAHQVSDLEQELKLLRVVPKGTVEPLLEAVRAVIEEGLPTLNRGLFQLLRKVQRDYMWEFVAHHWPAFQEQDDATALAHLLVRRLALTLETDGAGSLTSALPGGTGSAPGGTGGKVHPISMYVMPPIPDATPQAGDVRRGEIDGAGDHWIVLTPSCDFAQGKADMVLLAACEPLEGQPELNKFLAQPEDGNRRGALKALMKNGSVKGRQADRHHFLPGALDLPDLLVDLRSLKTVPRDRFNELTPVVSLDAPFAEALLAQFARYVGRLGTPDPDLDLVIERLRNAGGSASP
jgi:CheY-like chemotaxis protein